MVRDLYMAITLIVITSKLAVYARRLPKEMRFGDLVLNRKPRDTNGCQGDGCRKEMVEKECSVQVYKYGWGLHGSSYGCCGNYSGCCNLASMICYIHDVICACCGSILCGPQCKQDATCEKMLRDSDEGGSGELYAND